MTPRTAGARAILNLVVFYAGWIACVTAAAAGQQWIAIAACLAVVGVHLISSPEPGSELKLVAAAGLIGLIAESLLMGTGAARYAMSDVSAVLPPWWLVSLWMAFGTTLNVSLAWLRERHLLAALLGLAAAPPSYYAAAQIGAMELALPVGRSLMLVGLAWAAALPLLLAVATRLESESR
jgi:hypothetical protein